MTKRSQRVNKNKPTFGLSTAPTIRAQTANQQKYMNAIFSSDIVLSKGPAGTGKTWLATALAAQALCDNRISKIILTRPAVEAGEKLGFLPGDLEEKYSPYLAPFIDVLNERLGAQQVAYLLKKKDIETIPLAYMRGRTFRDCWVILDEAQNTTTKQMKLLLTRTGENCKVIVNGDTTQKDIKEPDGLSDAFKRLADCPGISRIQFTKEDVVRSEIVKLILDRYDDVDG